MIYLKDFETEGQYNSFLVTAENTDGYRVPNASSVETTENIHYNDYAAIPLTFQIIGEPDHQEGDTYQISLNFDGPDQSVIRTIQYRINNGAWDTITFDDEYIEDLKPGDEVQFRSQDEWTYTFVDESSNFNINYFGCDTYFNVFGNMDSLNYYDPVYDGEYQYYHIFGECKIVSAKHLILPSTTLESYCYRDMFYNCTYLTAAPALPATLLEWHCYDGMFRGCTALTTAPELPATTLVDGCYNGMFSGCTSLTTAPVLPAPVLANNCYFDMFRGCTSLTTAPMLPAMTLASNCYGGMFQGCTSLITAPALPATTLVYNCYSGMFYNCTSLNYIKCLATDISENYCTQNWVSGVSSSGTFVKSDAMTGWTMGVSGIPIGWDVKDWHVEVPVSLVMWVDDFINEQFQYKEDRAEDCDYDNWADYMDDYLEDPASFGSNPYRNTGEQITWNGNVYYIWEYDPDLSGQQIGVDAPYQYLLTETNNYAFLHDNSIEADYDNEYCPYVTMMNCDYEGTYLPEQRAEWGPDWLVKVERLEDE